MSEDYRQLSMSRKITYSSDMVDEKNEYVSGLYTRYRLRLNRSLRKLIRNEEDIADVVQDTFVRINGLDYPPKMDLPYTYLYRIAVNLIRDRGRAMKVRDAYKKITAMDDMNGVEYLSPEHHAVGRERLRNLSQMIDDLPPRSREVFMLHKMQNLSHREIAEKLDISLSAVEKNIMRVTAKIRTAFEKEME